MRKFIILSAAISLIGSASLAMAQDRDHRGPDRGNPAANGRNAIGQPQFREHHDAPSQPAETMRGINRALNGNPGRRLKLATFTEARCALI